LREAVFFRPAPRFCPDGFFPAGLPLAFFLKSGLPLPPGFEDDDRPDGFGFAFRDRRWPDERLCVSSMNP